MFKTTLKSLTLACLLSIPQLATAATYDFDDGTLKYTITDESNYYVEVYTPVSSEIVTCDIPSTVENSDDGYTYTVTSIRSNGFYFCRYLESVTISNTVTTIGDYAFNGCTSLTNVTIGSGVTTIGDYAFAYCTALESIVIPDNVTRIDQYAFRGCTSLTKVTLPESVGLIGGNTFNDCDALTTVIQGDFEFRKLDDGTYQVYFYEGSDVDVTIPSTVINKKVTAIRESGFYECKSMESITISQYITSIGMGAFYGCYALKSIEIPDNVTSIDSWAFYYCTSLESVTLSSSITSIETKTFAYCSALKSIEIPDNITSIGSYAFQECTSLTEVTIGSGVTTIGEYAFQDCRNLASITVNTESAPSCANSYVFDNVTNSTLYIPFSWNEKFKSNSGWKDFLSVSSNNVTRFCTITSAQYATLYSSHAVEIPTDVVAYVAKKENESTVTCKTIDDGIINAETGVILFASGIAEDTRFDFPETDSSSSETSSILTGTLDGTTVESGAVYVLNKVDGVAGFYKYNGTTISYNKAYLVPETTDAKGFSIVFNDDETTGIEAVTTAAKSATNGAIYNLQGQRVSTPTKGGVYIQNGKKFVVK